MLVWPQRTPVGAMALQQSVVTLQPRLSGA